MNELKKQLDRIEQEIINVNRRLDKFEKIIPPFQTNSAKLQKHIDNVESIYTSVRTPINQLISWFTPTKVKLPLIDNDSYNNEAPADYSNAKIRVGTEYQAKLPALRTPPPPPPPSPPPS